MSNNHGYVHHYDYYGHSAPPPPPPPPHSSQHHSHNNENRQQMKTPSIWSQPFCASSLTCGPSVPACGPSPSMLSSRNASFADNSSVHSLSHKPLHSQPSQPPQQPHQRGSTMRSFMDGLITPFINCVQPQLSSCISGPATEWRPHQGTTNRRSRSNSTMSNDENQRHYTSRALSPNRTYANSTVENIAPASPHQHGGIPYSTTTNRSISRVLGTSPGGMSYGVGGITESNVDATYEAKDIVRPNDNDVLCGRGNNSNRHPGNINFRDLIAANKTFYSGLTKKEKMLVARQIVDIIHHGTEPPGRFLCKDSTTGLWYNIGMSRSVEKTSQALREKSALEKQQAASLHETNLDDKTETSLPGEAAALSAESTNSMSLSPGSSTISGVLKDVNDEAKSAISNDSTIPDVSSIIKATRSRANIEPPPIQIPKHLKSIYQRIVNRHVVTTPQRQHVESQYSPAVVTPYLQTPSLDQHQQHPYHHQYPHSTHPYGSYHYPPNPHYGGHEPTGQHRGFQAYHPPGGGPPLPPPHYMHTHQPPYLQPRNDTPVDQNYSSPMIVPPSTQSRSFQHTVIPHQRNNQPYYQDSGKSTNVLPPRYASGKENFRSNTPQQHHHARPHNAGSANAILPHSSYPYSTCDSQLTPTTDNRRIVAMSMMKDPANLPSVLPLPPIVSRSGTVEDSFVSDTAAPVASSTTVSAISREKQNTSPILQQDWKRQRTSVEENGIEVECVYDEVVRKSSSSPDVNATSSPLFLSQAMETHLTLEERESGCQFGSDKNVFDTASMAATAVTDELSSIVSKELASPSSLVQGRSKTRTNTYRSSENIVDQEMDGLAALSTAAFLRLDEFT